MSYLATTILQKLTFTKANLCATAQWLICDPKCSSVAKLLVDVEVCPSNTMQSHLPVYRNVSKKSKLLFALIVYLAAPLV